MKKKIFFVLLLLSSLFAKSQTAKDVIGYWSYDYVEGKKGVIIPNDTLVGAKMYSIAVKNGVAYVKLTYWTPISGYTPPIMTEQTYTSGATLTITNGVSFLNINPSAITDTLRITLPTTAAADSVLRIETGGTLLAGIAIRYIQISAPSGQTILQLTNPNGGILYVGDYFEYRKKGTVWKRLE